jgi:uncharacterized membrane protein
MRWFRRKHRPVVPPVIEQNIRSITQLESEFASQRSPFDRISDVISGFAGSIQFIAAHVVFFTAWLVTNSPWGLGSRAFDPYPYVFLNFVLAVEAVLLGTFVLMSQNRQNHLAEQRGHLELQINLLAEQETTKTLQLLQVICERLGIDEVAWDEQLKQMIATPMSSRWPGSCNRSARTPR